MMRAALWIVGLTCLGFAGCATTSDKMDLVRKRAGFDLVCQGDLQISELGDNTFGVEGCGKRAAYNVNCRQALSTIDNCVAVMNSVK